MNSNLPKVGAEAVLVTDDYERSVKSAIALADKFDKSINDLSGSVDMKVTVNDADLKSAKGLADDLDTSTSTKVNVDDSELQTANDTLDDIATIGAIDLAINIAGQTKEFFDSLGRFSGVGGVLELDAALATIQGRTGRMIPDAEKLITDLYTNGWGESRSAIAETIVEASNLKIANEDLAEATLGAFQTQAVIGGDTNEILRTMDSLVKNGLVPDYTTAADLIVTGFQTGNDRGQDLLDTLNEYGSTFQNLRISGDGALGLINSGLDAGVDNSDRIADAIRETGIRLGEIGTDENIANAFTRLDELSDVDLATSLDAFNAGEISGDEFFEGFFTALGDAVEADPVEAQTLAATLVGTIAEDFGVESIAQLTPVWDETMGTLEGRAETAGNTISNTLGTTVETFLRGVEQAAVDFLSSDQIDLDGKIETLKTQIATALSTLSEGGTLGEALEIGFGVEGVDTALGNIERVFGQFVLAILEVVATLQDPLGINDADAGTRAQIRTMATQQLPFDIKLANPEELDAIFNQAANRGVTDLGGALNTALTELVAEGDFAKVNDILDQIALSAEVTPEAIAALREKYEALIAAAQPPPGQLDVKALDTGALEDTLGFRTSGAGTSRGNKPDWWESFAGEVAQAAIEDSKTQIDDWWTSVTDTVATAAADTTTSGDEMIASMEGVALQAQIMDADIANAMMGNTVTASFDAVLDSADASFPGVIEWFERTAGEAAQFDSTVSIHLRSVTQQLNDLNFLALTAIANVTQAQALGGGGSVTNNTTTNMNVTNNNSNGAQTANSQYQLAQMLG